MIICWDINGVKAATGLSLTISATSLAKKGLSYSEKGSLTLCLSTDIFFVKDWQRDPEYIFIIPYLFEIWCGIFCCYKKVHITQGSFPTNTLSTMSYSNSKSEQYEECSFYAPEINDFKQYDGSYVDEEPCYSISTQFTLRDDDGYSCDHLYNEYVDRGTTPPRIDPRRK